MPTGSRLCPGSPASAGSRGTTSNGYVWTSAPRYGGRQALLEIDEGESLHFFSRYDLGAPPSEALDRVLEVRAARS